jgi:hypothetical protein
MDRNDLEELHFITAIENVPSILSRGILSHNRVQSVPHRDVSMEEVQDIRAGRRVPNGGLLHDYANVYIQARNAMLYCLLHLRDELVVLRLSPNVLDLAGAVISDGNAAVRFTAFAAAPDGLRIVDQSLTFAQRWTHDDSMEYRRRKAACCAEVLVPHCIPGEHVVGAYAGTIAAVRRFEALGARIPVVRSPRLFFLV